MNGSYVGYALICIGLLLPVAVIYGFNRPERERQWLKTIGIVVTSRVDYDGELYRPRVEYAYQLEGLEYHAQTVRSFGLMFNFKGPAEKVCSRYPVGAKVDVFADPDDPRQAVLEPGGDGALIPATLGVSLLLVLLGFYWLR